MIENPFQFYKKYRAAKIPSNATIRFDLGQGLWVVEFPGNLEVPFKKEDGVEAVPGDWIVSTYRTATAPGGELTHCPAAEFDHTPREET